MIEMIGLTSKGDEIMSLRCDADSLLREEKRPVDSTYDTRAMYIITIINTINVYPLAGTLHENTKTSLP